jgi:hypothetical protein
VAIARGTKIASLNWLPCLVSANKDLCDVIGIIHMNGPLSCTFNLLTELTEGCSQFVAVAKFVESILCQLDLCELQFPSLKEPKKDERKTSVVACCMLERTLLSVLLSSSLPNRNQPLFLSFSGCFSRIRQAAIA